MKGLADKFVKAGFWSQLVLLGLLDWASIAAFRRGGVAWYHFVGFALVNIVLLMATALMWNWMRDQRGRPMR